MTAKSFTGPLRLSWAIAKSGLTRTEKDVLHGLEPHVCWNTWTTRVGISGIAANASLGERTVQTTIRHLVKRGVLEFSRESRGGTTHTIQINVKTLESLANGARAAGLTEEADGPPTGDPGAGTPQPASPNPAPDATEPRSPCAVTPQATASNPAVAAGEQNTEQRNQQTTTTTSGGGGGNSLVEHMSEALVVAGVSQNDAHRLARLPGVTPTLVTFAVEQARRPGVHNPGRYIAKLLRTPPKDLDGYERFEADRLNRRQGRFTRILAAAGERAQRGHADAGQLRADAAIIRSVWPDGFAFATDFVLPDAELLAKDADFLVLFARIADVARSRRTAKNPAA